MVEPMKDSDLYKLAANQDQEPVAQKSKPETINPTNALLASIAEKGSNSYYYAHAPKEFSTEGAQHFKGDGKIYGGNPVLITTKSSDAKPAEK